MKLALSLACLFLALSVRPGAAAELVILQPADRSVVKGAVTFRIRPKHARGEEFFSNPDIILRNEYGQELRRITAPLDPKTGICSATLDTGRLEDGLYLVTVTYRWLVAGDRALDTREELMLGVRNRGGRPARFSVEVEDRDYRTGDGCNVVVRVFDQRGRLLPAARVALKVDRGSLNSEAEITDSRGEVFTFVDSEEPGTVRLTVTVEDLPPVTRAIRFVP